METFPSPNKPPFLEKFLRLGIMGAVIFGGIKAYNSWIAPNINLFMSNLPYLIGFIIFCIFAAATVLYVISNPAFIWMQYKNLCHYVTSYFIRMDPLGFMDNYILILTDKRAGLAKSKENLNAQAISLKRQIDNLAAEFNSAMRKAEAAVSKEDKGHYASMANTYKSSAEHLEPTYKKLVASKEFLDKLYDNWGRSLESMKETVKVKREEFNACKEAAKAMGFAQDFAKGDSEEYRVFMQSTEALEQNVTSKMAFIEGFMEDSKDMMKSIDLDKQVDENEGLKLLEQYKNNKNLFLPESDWTSANVITATPISSYSSSSNKSSNDASKLIDIK